MVFYKYRRQNLDGYEILQEIHQGAAVLGAKCHVFHGPLKAENIAFSRLTEGLFQVAEAAASWGIKLALENVSWCAGWSPAVFRQLNTQNIPNLYYTFDSKQAMRSGFGPKDFISVMGKRLLNVHFSRDNGYLPGEDTDCSGLASALAEVQYTGPVVLEVYGSQVASVSSLHRSWRAVKAKLQKK
jgi:sugar phosphate isomerase/epimerase